MISRLRFLLAILFCLGLGAAVQAQNKEVTRIPFKLNNEHIIVKLSLNDSGPLNFIFDTGAGAALLARTKADSLGYEKGIKRKNIGVSGEHKVNLIRGLRLNYEAVELIGNLSLLSTQTFFEELDNGAEVHGVIGYNLLKDYVIEINYGTNELILYRQAGYNYTGEGRAVPIYLVQNLPIIDANVLTYNGAAFQGQFMVDTGARSDVIINSPTVLRYDLAENVGKYYTLRARIGTSTRRTKMRYGRLASFQFADY